MKNSSEIPNLELVKPKEWFSSAPLLCKDRTDTEEMPCWLRVTQNCSYNEWPSLTTPHRLETEPISLNVLLCVRWCFGVGIHSENCLQLQDNIVQLSISSHRRQKTKTPQMHRKFCTFITEAINYPQQTDRLVIVRCPIFF